MTTITFDTVFFDYNTIDEPLVAIPVSSYEEYRHLLSLSKVKKTLTKKKLNDIDIVASYNSAMKDYKNGEVIKYRDLV